MTLRELMVKILDCTENLDKPAVIRIVRRDAEGCAKAIRLVPVARYFGHGELVVEEADIDAATEERP